MADSTKESSSTTESGHARISQIFGDAPFVTQKLIEIEKGSYFLKLNELADFIEKSPESRTAVVRQIVEQGGSERLVRPDRLAGLESLNSILGADSTEMKTLITAESDHHSMISLQFLADFVEESPELRARLLKSAISEGTDYPILDTRRLLGLEYLEFCFR